MAKAKPKEKDNEVESPEPQEEKVESQDQAAEEEVEKGPQIIGGAKPGSHFADTHNVAEDQNDLSLRRIAGLPESAYKKVELFLDSPIHINGKKYEGKVIVPKHLAETLIPMLQSKKTADLEIFTGKNYLRHKLADGTLIIKEI